MLNIYQESYFLYHRSNLVKESFMNEIIKFIPLYYSAKMFGEKATKKKRLTLPANSKSLDLQIAKLSGESASTTDKKVHEILIYMDREKKEENVCC